MSSRFHSKWHRYNHHATPTDGIPDSAKDPIASFESPYLGEMVISGGPLSAHHPNGIYAAYFDDNIYVRDTIHTKNLTADFIDVNYIDINFYETSGFGVSGNDYNCKIPDTWKLEDTITLDGVGLSGTSWAALDGNVRVGKNLQTNSIIPVDRTVSNRIIVGCTSADDCSNFQVNDLGVYDTNQGFGMKICGDLSANAVFGLLNTASTELMLSATQCTTSSIFDTTLWNDTMNGNGLLVLTTEASSASSYAIVEGYTDDQLAARMVVGNPGNITNSPISHPLSAETILDNKQVMTFPLITNKDYEIKVVESHGDICHLLRIYQWVRDVNMTDLTIDQNLVVNNSAFFGDNIDLNCNDIVNVDTIQARVIEFDNTCGNPDDPIGIDLDCGSILDANLITFGNCTSGILDMNCGTIKNLSAIHNDDTCVDLIDINTDVQISTSGALILPVGSDAEGGNSYEQQGAIRYNDNINSFEGYSGSFWSGLGGVTKVDGSGNIEGTARAMIGPVTATAYDPVQNHDIWIDTSENVIRRYESGTGWVILGAAYL